VKPVPVGPAFVQSAASLSDQGCVIKVRNSLMTPADGQIDVDRSGDRPKGGNIRSALYELKNLLRERGKGERRESAQ
jgi:hypothetical protein